MLGISGYMVYARAAFLTAIRQSANPPTIAQRCLNLLGTLLLACVRLTATEPYADGSRWSRPVPAFVHTLRSLPLLRLVINMAKEDEKKPTAADKGKSKATNGDGENSKDAKVDAEDKKGAVTATGGTFRHERALAMGSGLMASCRGA